MRIFKGTSPGDGSQTIRDAVAAIARKAQEQRLLVSFWSLAELQPDNDDFQWLCDWAHQLSSGIAYRWLEEEPWQKFRVDGREFTYAVGIGTLLLMLAAERARREASEGSLWATVQQGHFGETTKQVLFRREQPSRAHKDAIEMAARRLRLRHVFGREGVQNWFDTVYLQFGFTKRGFMRRLPEWLTGQEQTLAIQQLNSGPMKSSSFQELWNSLQNFRRKYIREEELRSLLKKTPWVLPEWTDDLVRQARAKIDLESRAANTILHASEAGSDAFLSEPTLHWNPPDSPQFTCQVVNLEKLHLAEDSYDIVIAGHSCARLQKLSDGEYKAIPSDQILLSVAAPTLVANLVTTEGQVIQSLSLQLWNETEDVTAFLASSGRHLDPWTKTMSPNTAYILLLASDLIIEPEPLHWYVLDNSGAKLYFLPKGWPLQTHVLLSDNPLWYPRLTTSSSVSEPDWTRTVQVELYEAPKELLFGRQVRVSISHPQNVTIAFIRLGTQPIQCVQHDVTHMITEPITVKPSVFSHKASFKLEFLIGLRRLNESARVHRSLDLHITGAAILMQDGWITLKAASTLTLEEAKTQPVKFFLPDSEKRALMEGDMWVGRTWNTPRPIGTLAGLGAPLSVQEGAYNAQTAPLLLAKEVVDQGIIADVGVDDIGIPLRLLRIRLAHAIELDRQHSIIWWDKNGAIKKFTPSWSKMQEHDMWWLAEIPQDLTQPLVLAIAYKGARLGAWWSDRWSSTLRNVTRRDPRTIAAMIRWLQLPLLSRNFLCDVQTFAHTYPGPVLASWVLNKDILPSLHWADTGDGWLAAVRTVFWNWQPDSTISLDIIDQLAEANEDTNVQELLHRAVWRLLRINPLLMGKVVLQWMKSQKGTQNAYRLIQSLLHECAETDSNDVLHKKREALLEETANTMGVDPFFIKALVQRTLLLFQEQLVSTLDENNIAVAMNVEPFRRFLGMKILEKIDQIIDQMEAVRR